MIFRNSEGKLIEINRYDFKSDKLYYQKVMDLMKDIKDVNYGKNDNKTKNDGSIHKKGIK